MMNDIQLDQLMDRFHNGKLSLQEVKDLLAESNIPDGELLIQKHRSAIYAVEQYNLLMQVQHVHQTFLQNLKQPVTPVRSIGSRIYIMRIAAMLVISFSSWLLFQYANSSNEQLYQDLHSRYTLSQMRGDETTSTDLVKAFGAGNYQQTIALFNTTKSTGNREQFFAAISYLETGEPNKAITLFEQISSNNQKNNGSLYQDETDYYHSLALLKTGQKEKAIVLLKKIHTDQDHTYNRYVTKWMLLKIKWFGHSNN